MCFFAFTETNDKLETIINKDYFINVIFSLIEKIKQTKNYMEAYEYLENINIIIKTVSELFCDKDERIVWIVNEIEQKKIKKTRMFILRISVFLSVWTY